MVNLVTNTVNVLSDEELDILAVEEFKEDVDKLEEDIVSLQHWIKTQPHMSSIRQDSQFLRLFLRGCDYNLDTTKDKLDLFFSVRTNLPAWFSDWDPQEENIKQVMKAGVYLPMRGFDKEGRYVILIRQSLVDPDNMISDDCYKVFLMLLTLAMEGNVQACTRGVVVVSDQDGVGAGHALMMTPTVLKRQTVVFQDAFPMTNKTLIKNSRLIMMNAPTLIQKLLKTVLSYMDEQYRTMVKIIPRGNYEALKAEVGDEILPVEYGGSNGTVDDIKNFWIEEVDNQAEFLKKQTTYRTDESLREGKPRTAEDLFGSCNVM